MKLWRYSGILLVATGVIHSLAALYFYSDVYIQMMRDGLINSVGNQVGRGLALWFLVCGFLIILLGQALHYYIKEVKQPAPAFVGWAILIVASIGCLIVPVSGFWLFIPQAIIIIGGNRRVMSWKNKKEEYF